MKSSIKLGTIYLDCGGHPVICTRTDGRQIEGISLLDGSWPRGCSLRACRPRKITLRRAMAIKMKCYKRKDRLWT